MSEEKLKLVIDRTKWWRGDGPAHSALLSRSEPSRGKMCCLGFLSLACGYRESELAHKRTIEELLNHLMLNGYEDELHKKEVWKKHMERLPEKLRPHLGVETDIATGEILSISAQDNGLLGDLYTINDDGISQAELSISMEEYERLPEEERNALKEQARERLLKEKFAEAGVEVEFIN